MNKCRMRHVSCLMSHASHVFIMPYHSLSYLIMPYHTLSTYDSCLMFLASCLLPHDSWLMFFVSCLMRYETWPHGGGGTWDMRHETWAMSPAGSRHENWAMRHNSCLVAHGSWLMTHVLYLTVHVLPIFMAHASRRMAHVSRLTSHVSCPIVFLRIMYHMAHHGLMVHVSCAMSHVFTSHVLFPTDHVSCFIMTLVSCSMLHVSCLKSHASRPMSHVWYRRHETCMRHETRGLETRGMKKHEAWDARHETSRLLSLVSCLMPHDSCFLSPVFWDMRHDPPFLHGGRGVVTGDMRHENMSHEPPGPRHENWSHEKTRCTRHETWDTSYKTRNTRHETRVTRRKPSPPPWDMVCTKRVDSEGGGVFMEVWVHFWPFTRWPSSKYSVFIPVHKLVPPPLPHLPPPPTPSFSYLYYIYYRVGKGVGGRGEGISGDNVTFDRLLGTLGSLIRRATEFLFSSLISVFRSVSSSSSSSS